MATYTVTLTEAEDKAIHCVALSAQEWIENMAKERARLAIEEICAREIERMTNDPTVTSIPADKNQIVMEAQVESVAELNARLAASTPGTIA